VLLLKVNKHNMKTMVYFKNYVSFLLHFKEAIKSILKILSRYSDFNFIRFVL